MEKDFGKKKILIPVVCGGVVLICLVVFLTHFLRRGQTKEVMGEAVLEKNLLAPVELTAEAEDQGKNESNAPETKAPEEGIYTYLQGPKSWGKRLPWSGEWGVTHYDGGSFGGFGCGLCCIANLYSSLTPYQCTPADAYRFAKRTTEYHGGGAIDWGYMRDALTLQGFSCSLQKKSPTYEEFQKLMEESMAAVVLVSSADSKCYWKDTPGHYVTIFLYNKKSDKVFLADSGDPKHNRHYISLKKIYKSLKTASAYQFLNIISYDKKSDTWKHKKADGNWVKAG